ncbi:ABC transporter substrate-binding protein [Kineococcus sp. GCM10028916]|uniref:ABC transporter substrate-binding protein n=1 Tax=Kineococcus sp. GCM10028916 TaxID=3273394 RepID=UPI00363A8C10
MNLSISATPRTPGLHRPRRLSRLLRLTVAGAAALTLLATGCSAGGSGNGDDASTLVAYTGQAGDYQVNFNPFSPSDIGGAGLIFEPLFFINKTAADADPKPLLGTEHTWNDAGTELDVTLRDGVTWSDGKPFTADDVVFTFQMLLDHEALNSTGFDGTVTKVDATHVTFTWPEPAYTAGPDVLSATVIVPQHLWKDIDPESDVLEKPVGTGAYTLSEFKGQAFTMEANPKYWGGKPKVAKVRYLALSGNQAGADAIAAGTIDWQTGPIPDMANTHKNFPNYDTGSVAQNQMVLGACANADLGCQGPQTDPAVRQALFYAIDRTQLNKLAFQDTASEISPSMALTSTQADTISAKVDPEVAPKTAEPQTSAQVLEADGWVKGADGIYAKDGQKLTLTIEVVTGWTDYITAIQTIAAQAEAAGIDIQTAQSSWNEWTDKRFKGNFELAIDSLYQGPAPDPYYLYSYFYDGRMTAPVGTKANGNNWSRFSDPAVDAALDALQKLPSEDTAGRQAQFDVIQSAVATQMPYVPVMTGANTSVWNVKKFSGWPTNEDQYAFPAVWSDFDAAEILKTLTPQAAS